MSETRQWGLTSAGYMDEVSESLWCSARSCWKCKLPPNPRGLHCMGPVLEPRGHASEINLSCQLFDPAWLSSSTWRQAT